MIRASHSFPRRFLWGTATSAHQVEGDNILNDWWDWEQQPGRIALGQRSGKACDWWGGRWQEDFDRAAAGGQNAHRLSLEWSRVEPSPAVWDEAALEGYREIVRGALARGLMPMVTLHHFTNPRWVAEQGGWLKPGIVSLFERYVRKVVDALQDAVGLWVTINEPNVYMSLSYVLGLFPPGEKNLGHAFEVARNLIRAHVAAYRAIHEVQPGALVGLAHHVRGFRPARPASPLDRWAARARSRLFNDLFAVAAHSGRFRSLLHSERLPEAAGTQDFIGLNYYTQERVAFDLRRPGELFARGFFPKDADLSPTGYLANEPEGFWRALGWARKFGLPVYVTENGVEDAADRLRPRYLAAHLRQLWRAVNFNWPVKGYFHWTLVDNFEWERGWTQRFGLYELTPDTQERRKRASADLYAEVCKSNALSSETVALYAPEVVEQLFPVRRAAVARVSRG
ncbi:MAG: glycoside hydrolase family 1 protein [Chloroflexota bacterium]